MKFYKLNQKSAETKGQFRPSDNESEKIFPKFPSSGRHGAFEVDPIPIQTL